ncbi:MAG: hypothetical protein H6672_06470 [Anaerolineaceae bacterium]|nr:hypothetical protein [Anaerolineaceae bacterium]
MAPDDYAEGIRTIQKAISIFRDLGETHWEAFSLWLLARFYDKTGDVARAYQVSQDALTLCQNTHNILRMGFVLRYMGIFAYKLGYTEQTEQCMNQSLNIFRQLESNDLGYHEVYLSKGFYRALDGDFSSALNFAKKALFHASRVNYPGQTANSWQLLNILHLVIGNYPEAIRCACQGMQTMIDTGSPVIRADFHKAVGEACGRYGLGENDAAAALVREHFAPWNTRYDLRNFDIVIQDYHLTGLAYLLADAGEAERALELISLAVHQPYTPDWWLEREPLTVKLLARLKGCLSSAQYAAAWERGKSLDLNAALAALLDLPSLQKKR